MKKIKVLIFFSVLAVTSSIWLGFYPIAALIGIYSIIMGIRIFSEAQLKLNLLGLLSIQIIILCSAFGIVYYEIGVNPVDSITISFQNLFHVSIISVGKDIQGLVQYKIVASAQSFIGYLLIISGVSLMLKKQKFSQE